MNPIIQSINNVQDYIEKNIEEPLTLPQLAEVAQFSEYYFHRTYKAVTGESLYGYIKRNRLEKAAFLLISNPKLTITDVALSVGFASSSTFAKAFKQAFGISASAFKKGKNGKVLTNDAVYNGSIDFEDYYREIAAMEPISVDIKKLPNRKYIYYRYKGPYKGDSNLFQELFTKLYMWVKDKDLLEEGANFITLYHDFGSMTEENDLRLSVCMETTAEVATEGEFGTYQLDEGLYVVGRFEVTTEEYQKAWDYMFMHWLPKSRYYNDERLSYEAYPPIKASDESRRVVDICIPIAPL